jgi:hypothetical protein
MRTVIVLIALTLSQSAIANGAPFCVVAGFGWQCWYYDANSCQQAAAAARGMCVVNPDARR